MIHGPRSTLPYRGLRLRDSICRSRLRFIASQALVSYKRRGGSKTSPMPDFYIGAHALVARLPLITRDATRYAYFPELQLVAPI